MLIARAEGAANEGNTATVNRINDLQLHRASMIDRKTNMLSEARKTNVDFVNIFVVNMFSKILLSLTD